MIEIRPRLLPWWFVAWLAVLGACTGTRSAAEQVDSGRVLFLAHCQECHTVGIGPKLTVETYEARGTPRALFNYLRIAMPYETPGRLEEGEYWDIVAFLLGVNGLRDTTALLTPETADERLTK